MNNWAVHRDRKKKRQSGWGRGGKNDDTKLRVGSAEF